MLPIKFLQKTEWCSNGDYCKIKAEGTTVSNLTKAFLQDIDDDILLSGS
jgi:hypothetical protein